MPPDGEKIDGHASQCRPDIGEMIKRKTVRFYLLLLGGRTLQPASMPENNVPNFVCDNEKDARFKDLAGDVVHIRIRKRRAAVDTEGREWCGQGPLFAEERPKSERMRSAVYEFQRSFGRSGAVGSRGGTDDILRHHQPDIRRHGPVGVGDFFAAI